MRVHTHCRPRRTVCLLVLICFLLAGLAGCAPKAAPPQPGVTYTQMVGAMNRQLSTQLSQELDQAAWWGVVDGHLMAYGRGPIHEEEPEAPIKRLLLDMQPDGSEYASMALTLPPVTGATPRLAELWQEGSVGAAETDDGGFDIPQRSIVGVMAAGDGQLYLLLEDMLFHNYPDEEGVYHSAVPERALTLCNLGEDGAVQPLFALELPQQAAERAFIEFGCLTPDGSLWLAASDYAGMSEGDGCLLRYSLADGSLQTTLPLPQGMALHDSGLALLPDGSGLALLTQTASQDANGFYTSTEHLLLVSDITGAAPALGDPLPLPDALQHAAILGFAATLGDGPLLLRAMDGLYAWDPQANTAQKQLAWADYSLESTEVQTAFGLADGRFLAVCRANVADAPYRLHLLTPLDPDAVTDRTVITFGLQNMSSDEDVAAVKGIINAFNAASEEYFVEIVDYTNSAAAEKGYGEWGGDNMLYDDVINGNVPDILSAQGWVWTALQNKGFWVDMYPYLDEDPDLSREDFVPGILGACEYQGMLTSVVPCYRAELLVADPALVGEGIGWSLEDFLALCEAHPDAAPFVRYGRAQALRDVVAYAGDTFLDWENRQAHYDSPEFVRVLEACGHQPAEITDYINYPVKENLQQGTDLLLPVSVTDGWFSHNFRYVFENGFVYKGYPTADGGNGNGAFASLRLGITTYCEHPDAAWQLLRRFLLPDYQDTLGTGKGSYAGFPLRLDSLQKCLQRATENRNGPDDTVRAFSSPLYIPYDQVTEEQRFAYQEGVPQAEVDQLYEAITGIRALFAFDDTVFTVVAEEADAYYNGMRSAEEAAAIIQDRIQTYLDEQG